MFKYAKTNLFNLFHSLLVCYSVVKFVLIIKSRQLKIVSLIFQTIIKINVCLFTKLFQTRIYFIPLLFQLFLIHLYYNRQYTRTVLFAFQWWCKINSWFHNFFERFFPIWDQSSLMNYKIVWCSMQRTFQIIFHAFCDCTRKTFNINFSAWFDFFSQFLSV